MMMWDSEEPGVVLCCSSGAQEHYKPHTRNPMRTINAILPGPPKNQQDSTALGWIEMGDWRGLYPGPNPLGYLVRQCGLVDQALDQNPGDLRSILGSVTGLLGDLGQVTSLLCLSFLVCIMGTVTLASFVKHLDI